MPRITDERREARREQILEAARACLQEHGLEAVSMEMIIARSGLSTGAVYGYFKGKDEIINAVVTDGTAAMGRQLAPVLTSAGTMPAALTGCWSPCTAGATPRATPASRRPPAPPTADSASCSPTRSGGGRRPGSSTPPPTPAG
jgi:AcrR family transcriptional regulator